MTFKHFKYVALGACAASALLATDANAQSQQVVGATVNLTVQNAFTLVETTPMNYGTLAAFCDAGANSTTATLSTAGVLALGAPAATAQFIDISAVGRTQGVFDVTGAAPTTSLTVTLANPANATCAACGGGNPPMTLGGLTDDTLGTVTTDANGALTINVGATLTTQSTCLAQYADGAYVGTYDITVSY